MQVHEEDRSKAVKSLDTYNIMDNDFEDIFARFGLNGPLQDSSGAEPGTLRSDHGPNFNSADDPGSTSNEKHTSEHGLLTELNYSHLSFGKLLGNGTFATVQQAVLKQPYLGHTEVAVKTVTNLNAKEVTILKKLKDDPHQNIIQFLAYIKHANDHLIITELARRGSLYEFLSRDSDMRLPLFVVQKWVGEIAAGIQFLHDRNVVHRDIKSSNCLLFDKCLVKICDFGIAQENEHSAKTMSLKGSARWMAPEMLGDFKYSKPSDIYSFGMVTLEICTRKVPFAGEPEKFMFIRDGQKKPSIPNHCPEFLQQLMMLCWEADCHDRPTINDIVVLLEKECKGLEESEGKLVEWEQQNFTQDYGISSLVSNESRVVNECRTQRTEVVVEYAQRETAVFEEMTPKITPEATSEDTSDGTSEVTQGATSDKTPKGALQVTPKATPVATSKTKPEVLPEVRKGAVWAPHASKTILETTPEGSSEETLQLTPDVTPETTLQGIPREFISNKECKLSQHVSDLQMELSADGFSAKPLTEGGFAYLYAGVKASHGVKAGKVCFDVKVTKDLDVSHLPPEEEHPHVVRVGWSTVNSGLYLGRDKLSYGYGGTHFKSSWGVFKEYGETFGKGDVITCHLDFTEKSPVISFAKNGEDLGLAYTIKREDLQEQALYPHVLLKNAAVEINLGQNEPAFPPKAGFTYVRQLSEEHCVMGPLPPSKEDCEVLMMIGLSGSGKTTWVKKHCKENPDKDYIILGTNKIMYDMRVKGLKRGNYMDRYDKLIEPAGKCFERLLNIASHRNRNYIIDQTNVKPSSRRNKIMQFEDFHRKAIVIVPSSEDFRERVKKQKLDGKDIPNDEVKRMIVDFRLPEEPEDSPCFNEVQFVELKRDEAAELLSRYQEKILLPDDVLPML